MLGARADWVNDKQDNYIKDKKTDENNFAISPRVGLVYLPMPDLSLYATYSQSLVPQSGQTKDGEAFDPITSKQWEAGVKKSFFNDRLSTGLAFYTLSKTNLPTIDPEDEEYKILIGKQQRYRVFGKRRDHSQLERSLQLRIYACRGNENERRDLSRRYATGQYLTKPVQPMDLLPNP